MTLKICAIGLLCALVGMLLSEYGWRGKKLFAVISVLLIISFITDSVVGVVGEVREFAEYAGISEAAECALKVVGVGYIFGVCADICSELGESSISSALVSVGRIESFLLVLPYIKKIIDMGVGLIS